MKTTIDITTVMMAITLCVCVMPETSHCLPGRADGQSSSASSQSSPADGLSSDSGTTRPGSGTEATTGADRQVRRPRAAGIASGGGHGAALDVGSGTFPRETGHEAHDHSEGRCLDGSSHDGHDHESVSCETAHDGHEDDEGRQARPGSHIHGHGKKSPDGHDHGDDDEDEHGDEIGAVIAMDEKERLEKRCEHGLRAVDCGECSASVGVIRVNERLLEPSGGNDPLVKIGRAGAVKLVDGLETYGHIAIDEEQAAHVTPQVNGTIESVLVELGAQVKKGQPLLVLSSVTIGKAAAEYLKALALYGLAEKELNRARRLLSQGVTSAKEVYRLESNFEQARIEKDASRRQLVILGVPSGSIDDIGSSSRLLKGLLTIRAPIDGHVLEKHAVNGEYVAPGKAVMLIADLRKVWVWAQVYDKEAGKVLMEARNKGRSATIRIAAFPDRKFEGTIDYVSPIVSSDTRTVRIRILADNREGLLLPGMFCRVTLPFRTHEVTAVPRRAVVGDGPYSFVFRPLGKGRLVVSKVEPGVPHGELATIRKGLSPGDLVVTRGAFMLKSELLKERMGAG